MLKTLIYKLKKHIKNMFFHLYKKTSKIYKNIKVHLAQ